MKRVLKILLILILTSFLGMEIYVYLSKNKKIEETKEILEEVDTTFLADIYTGYSMDPLTYEEVVENNQVYYSIIKGLKNKKIEKQVNAKIKEKIDKLKKSIGSNYLSTMVFSNFENTISIGFCTGQKYDDTYHECTLYNTIDSLNFDLTTGNEIQIKDIVNQKDALKQSLIRKSYEDFSKYKGLICHGGPCTNPNPDYSSLEDEVFQVMLKFNQGDYYFIYTPVTIYLYFDGLNILDPEICDEYENGCYLIHTSDSYKEYVKDNYRSEYQAIIPLLEIFDHLTIYDKFKTQDSIYEKESTIMSKKLIDTEDSYFVSEMIESTNALIDYNLIHLEDSFKPIKEICKKDLLNELPPFKQNSFNYYDVLGNITTIHSKYYYVYYEVFTYQLDKNTYENNKRNLYIEQYSKLSPIDFELVYKNYDWVQTENGFVQKYTPYPAFEKNLTNHLFYYYIYDTNGNALENKNILNYDYLSNLIPDEWLSLGSYQTKKDMIDHAFIIHNETHSYPERLVIYDDSELKLKYKGKEIVLADNWLDKIESQLYQ